MSRFRAPCDFFRYVPDDKHCHPRFRVKARFTLLLGTFCAVLCWIRLGELARLARLRREVFVAILVWSWQSIWPRLSGSASAPVIWEKFRQISPLMQFSVYMEGVAKSLDQRMARRSPRYRHFNDEANLLAAAIGFRYW